MEKPLVHPVLPAQRALEIRRKAAEIRAGAKKRSAEILKSAEEQAQALELAAEVFEAEASGKDITSLQTSSQHAKVRAMLTAHRVSLSAAHASPHDRLTKAANEAAPPHSVNSLAKVLGVSPTLLRAAHKGKGSIKESLCLRVRDVLGKYIDDDGKEQWRFDATVENWPEMRRGK